MTSTIELFEKALQKKNAAAWARTFNLTPSAFSHVKKQGRLSPVLAGNFAIELGEDPVEWIAKAALEAERETEQLTRLQNRVKNWRRRSFSHNKVGPRNRAFSFQTRMTWSCDSVHSSLHARRMNTESFSK